MGGGGRGQSDKTFGEFVTLLPNTHVVNSLIVVGPFCLHSRALEGGKRALPFVL